MSKFEDQKNDNEVSSSPEKLSGNIKENETVSKDVLREEGKKESEEALNVVNVAVEEALDSLEDNPELKDEISKLASDAKGEIGDLVEDFKNKLENEGFGDALITNPRILDLIAEIEYCHVEDKEMKEQMIQNWKRMIDGQYKEVLEDHNFDPEYSMGLIYGNAGWDRFKVINGEVQLINNPGANLNANESALKRAKELGMKISES